MATEAEQVTRQKPTSGYLPLRIWPPILLLAAIVLCRNLPSFIEDPPMWIWMVAGFGPLLCCGLIVAWWVAASRGTTRERVVGFLGVLFGLVATALAIHPTMLGPAFIMLTIPLGIAAFSVTAILLSRMLSFRRTVAIVLAAIVGFSYSTLLRSEGMWGDFRLGLHWRWDPSAEDELLAKRSAEQSDERATFATAEGDEPLGEPEWPAFRGPNRDGVQYGSLIRADWKTEPPKQLWKIDVGPGWSSFAVAGDLLFTQEQLGPQEMVTCYSAESGDQIWVHEDESRFSDPLGGPGPRATPTLAEGGLFATGASGHLTRLDPINGELVWQQDLREVAGREPPEWGFSASPLVTNGLVIVHAGGEGDKGILAFNAESGELRWGAPSGDHSYSSPQLTTIAGQPAILMVTNTGLHVLDPNTGKVRLDYDWTIENYRALQPRVLADDNLLIPSGMGSGTRRIRILEKSGKLTSEELWTSRQLKGDYNDFVVYQDHVYGFDGSIFTCISLEDGKRRWKRGRYGNGQVLLIRDSGLLLVTGEQGELVLLEANPDRHVELANIPALEGKTWNHPVLIGDRLYIRNSQEAACYQLPLIESGELGPTPLALNR